jgi:AcrR family transcriptional regulator
MTTNSQSKTRVKKAATSRKVTPVRWNNVLQSRDELNEAKRLALVRTAGTAFKTRGFHNTSLEDLAAALNVTKPTLYYYIDNKQDLLYRCHQYALDLGDRAHEYARDGRDGLEKLLRMLSRYIELMTDDFAAYSLLSDLNDLSEDHKTAIQTRRRAFDTVFRNFINEGIQDGSIRSCDPMLTVAWFMGAVNAIPRWFDTKGRMSGADVAAAYADLLTRAIRA